MIGIRAFGTRTTAITFTLAMGVVAVALLRINETRIVHARPSTPETKPQDAGLLGESIAGGGGKDTNHHDKNYVVAIGGRAFTLEETPDGISASAIVTSRPVFKAFGWARDGKSLLYTPLTNGVPSGELYIEDFDTGQSKRLRTDLVLEASWSPTNPNEVAYTFSKGDTFGLALMSVDSGSVTIIVPEHVLPDILQWGSLGSDIFYFEVDDTLEQPIIVAKAVHVQTGISRATSQSDVPSGFPDINSTIRKVPRQEVQTQQDSTHPFLTSTADGLHEIWGNDLLGDSMLYARTVSSDKTTPLGKGQILRILRGGVIIREFTGNGTRTLYVSWNGPTTELGPTVIVSFNLPLAGQGLGQSFVVTQGGSSYPPPGNCQIFSHTGSLSFAYDMQRAVVGAHVLASAAGQVVLVTSTVTCNSLDTNCPDYSASCTSGFGNTVVIQHADGTHTRYAHMQANSVQVSVGATVCQGQYIGRQGHTGQTSGSFNQCGDHLHFQRQQDASGASISVSFSDVASNPLSCGTSYTSGSTEITSCCSNGSSESYRAFGGRPPVHPNGTLTKISGNSTVYLIQNGHKRGITSASVLSNLYQQANSDFSNDVITVASDELTRYPDGASISSALPSNGRGQPEGRLIRQSGGTEVSIVTDGGHRRPFATQQAFLGLGYQFCKVIDVGDYSSYPQGPPVEAMPVITSSISVSPSAPYSVGQTITGTFSLTNIGTAPVTFAVVTIGGRLNGGTVTDFPFHTNVTISSGQTVPYQDNFTFSNTGSYSFFPAYQTQDGIWRIGLNHEIPTDPGISDLLTLNVSPCAYSVSPPSASFSSSGGPGSFSVTTQTGCGWSASIDVGWITTSSSGTGSGTVNYSVAQNSSTGSRTGHVNVQGQTHTVNQSGISCSYSVSPPSASFSSSGGPGSFSVATQTGCGWSASSDVAWITTSSSGTGSGTVNYSVAQNSSTSSRTGHVTVQGQVHTVNQAGAPILQPDLIVTALTAPTTGSIGGQITVSVTVANQGSASAGAFRLGFYFSTDSTITTGDTFTGWYCDFPSGLAAGDSTTCGGPVGVPTSLSPGTYYFGAIADDLGAVAESNETNNTRSADTGPITLSGSSHTSTVGLYFPGNAGFYLRNSNTTGGADVTFSYGPAGLGWIPLVGDWNGDGTDTIGLYNPGNGTFYLRNSNSIGFADITFSYGPPGQNWVPLTGDWNGDGVDTVGLYNPANGVFYLRNTNSVGVADITFSYGPVGQGWIPLVGDWNGDGVDTVGLYNPSNSAFYLRNSNTVGNADLVVTFGPSGSGWTPIIGDWNADGTDTIGLYNPSIGGFYLRNSNSFGGADIVLTYGPANAGWKPIVGDWDGL
jgi:murein DD-endopeptidase MepM/ murein hydrolase activator NlpD